MRLSLISALTKRHPQAAVVLPAFVALAVIYSIVTPPLEAGDESRHYAVVKYMADTGRLITQNAPETASIQHHWSHEGNQPPLYYALAAALTAWIDTGSWDDVFWYNPHTTIGNPLRPDNKNITIHPPGQNWPWRGHVLAVHLIRFLSIIMAAVTVMACYAIALHLFRGRRWSAAGAMAITAFNPMFIFISSSINNDNAVIMFITLALWLMVLLIENDNPQRDNSPSTIHSSSLFTIRHAPVLLGLLIGLGALSKLYAIGLLPVAGLVLIWRAYKTEQAVTIAPDSPGALRAALASPQFWRKVALWNLTLGLVFLAVAGWFYLRNALLYNGDLLALQMMRDTAGQREEIPSLATIRAEFKGFRIAYWALFGGVNILAHPWIYTLLDWLSLIAALGLMGFIACCVLRITKRTRHSSYNALWVLVTRHSLPTFTLLLLWTLIMAGGFIYWNLTQPAGQGRLLYPAIAAISALGMLGLSWWLPALGQKIVAGGGALGLFLFAALAPFLYIAPAYAHPPRLTESELPAGIQPVDYIYDDSMRLIGYQLRASTVRPAETLPLTLYWQLLRPVEQDYSIFIHILGRRREVVGELDTYPGGGAWPTTLLAPGDILADDYEIPIKPEAELTHAPARLRIAAGIYNYTEPGRPGQPVANANGQPVEPVIASAKLIPWQWPDPPVAETTINFFDKATLLSYHIADNQKSVTLNWRAESRFDADYTVFIQAWDAETNQYVAGFDGPPVQGDYPTSFWAPGEIIVDTHPLDPALLPPGRYDLLAGLYNPTTGQRLPAFNADGLLPDYAVNLGRLIVKSNE